MTSKDRRQPPGSPRGHSGVDSGRLWGDPGVTLGGQREVRGGQRRVRGGRRRPNFFFHFRRFKIMKLCQNLNFLWKRMEIDSNKFFEQLFSESVFYKVFSGATCTKISEIFS